MIRTQPTPAARRFVDAALDFLEEADAGNQWHGHPVRRRCPVNWPETMAKIEADRMAARRRAAAMHREARPVAYWRARYCPMVGDNCLTNGAGTGTACVQWAGDESAGFCTQLAAMRLQIGGRPC